MKMTNAIAKIATTFLVGNMVLVTASCESVQDKYIKDLESRVASVEAAVQAKDRAAYDTTVEAVESFLKLDFASGSAEEKAYADIKSGKKPLAEKNLSDLDSLKNRYESANNAAPANAESDFEFKTTADFSGVIISGYKGKSKNVVIPATIQGIPVVKVGNRKIDAFGHGRQMDGFENVTSVFIPDSVIVIGQAVFYKCDRLAKVTLSSNLEAIQQYAFDGCKSLEAVVFPTSLKLIDRRAFFNTGLKELRLNEGLLCLGRECFDSCENLTAIYFPKSLRWVTIGNQHGGGIAEGCPTLETISVSGSVLPKCPVDDAIRIKSIWGDGKEFSKFFSGAKIKESIALQKKLADYGNMPFFSAHYGGGEEGKAYLELWEKYGTDEYAY